VSTSPSGSGSDCSGHPHRDQRRLRGRARARHRATAGLVIAAYQLGYGIAAFGAGPLQDAGVSLPAIFAFAAIAAGAMAVLSFVIARPRHHVTALHPRPA
jgi:predicted MFS family arabinose efflux permease